MLLLPMIAKLRAMRKSYLASALAHKACHDGYSALYTRAAAPFRNVTLAPADASLRTLLVRLGRIDVLVTNELGQGAAVEKRTAGFLGNLRRPLLCPSESGDWR